jgi:hypothetical protein
MSAIERTFRYRIEQTEGRNHRACGKNLDLEVASGHVVDLLCVIERVFVKNVLRRPRALKAHADGALRIDDARRGDCGGGPRRSHFQKVATSRGLAFG